jgi:hypothetical protein
MYFCNIASAHVPTVESQNKLMKTKEPLGPSHINVACVIILLFDFLLFCLFRAPCR